MSVCEGTPSVFGWEWIERHLSPRSSISALIRIQVVRVDLEAHRAVERLRAG